MFNNNFQYLKRSEINTQKWDACIDTAANGLIYAYSFYLDGMTTNWHALVWGDYEAIMPLPCRKKIGIQYIYQPAFTASLGVFGNRLTEELVKKFMNAIPPAFRLIDTRLNYGNLFTRQGGFSRLHSNYVLNLQEPYDALYGNYRENIKRNIKKAQQLANRYVTGIAPEEVIALSKAQMENISRVTAADYANFSRLYNYLHQKGRAIACGVYTANNELVSSCIYFFSHNRAYYIMVGNHPNGRTLGASHYLIDRFIHDHAGQSLLLDFEGSDIRNLAFFYASFGAQQEVYPSVYVNRLPWWIRFLK